MSENIDLDRVDFGHPTDEGEDELERLRRLAGNRGRGGALRILERAYPLTGVEEALLTLSVTRNGDDVTLDLLVPIVRTLVKRVRAQDERIAALEKNRG